MERLLPPLSLVIFCVLVVAAAWLWDRHRLRKAIRAHRRQIEAFAKWFDAETSHDQEVIADIHRTRRGEAEVIWVYLRRGGYFHMTYESRRGQKLFTIMISKISGCSLEHFPPHGTRFDEPWFTDRMQEMFRIAAAWPREWQGSERALRVASGLPDPLDGPAAA